ncbi:MAG: hypothetical protein DIU61_016850 [Bacteroidota bacterium]|jgi:hypothetical protein|nr:MAG: hypothetical protein DIU61_09130 [Bacteroidota bacterium]
MNFGNGVAIISHNVIPRYEMMNASLRVLFCVALLSVSIHSHGKFRNGHESRLRHAQDSLPILRQQLATSKGLSLYEKQRLKSRIAELKRVVIYHELTRDLLDRLKVISPGLYYEMNDLRDRRGRPTDIYVRLIPKQSSRVPFAAASILSNTGIDRDAPTSEHGTHSVAVDLWISERALLMLSHELGHLSYIVPNLAHYSEFYRKHYRNSRNLSRIGHLSTDNSGQCARDFEKRYVTDYRTYAKQFGRPPSILSTHARVRRELRDRPPSTPAPAPWYELPDITTNR